MKEPLLVLGVAFLWLFVKSWGKLKVWAVALTCGSSFYISNTKRRASKSPAFVV